MRIQESFPVAGVLIAIALQACASSAPATKAIAEPAVQTPVAPPAGPENPYPGTKMRKGPNGTTVYCKKEVETGDLIAKERCYTAHAMEQLKESKRDQVEKIRENSGYATGGT